VRTPEATWAAADRRERPVLVGLALCLAITILVCFVSNNLNARFQHRNDSVAQQFEIVSGDPLLFDGRDLGLREWRSRVLVPFALVGVSRAVPALSPGQWFLILRLATAFAAFVSFWFVLRRTLRADVRLVAAGLFLLAYEVIFTFNEGWENTTDFPEVAFAALMVWAILGHRRWWLLGLVLVATLNREVSVFAGLIWLFLHALKRGRSIRLKEVAFGVGLSLVAYAEALAVRTIMTRPAGAAAPALGGGVGALTTRSDPGYAGQLAHAIGFWNRVAFDINAFLHRPTPSDWPVLWLALLAPASIWIALNWRWMRPAYRRLLLATVCLFPITLAYGTPSEIREYITPLVMLAYLAVALEAERQRAAPAAGLVYEAPARDPVEV
jgi:hypothetical protein